MPPVVASPHRTGTSHSGIEEHSVPEREIAPVLDEDAPPVVEGSFFSRLASNRSSSWLTSTIIHLVALIALALLSYRLRGTESGVSIDGAISSPGTATAITTLTPTPELLDDDAKSTEQPIKIEMIDLPDPMKQSPVVSSDTATPIAPSALAELKAGGSSAAADSHFYLGGGGMSARTPEGRKKNGDLYGATAESEAAVEKALQWLADHQRSDGSWSFDLKLDPCEGQCRHGKRVDEDTPTPATAATGLALLAFLGAGNTDSTGPHKLTVKRGLYYLKAAAVETQHGYDWQQGGSMYGHGIAMMALSEALGMTRIEDRFDSDLLHHVDRGAFFTVIAQHPNGSWGYTPGSPGDTTLTGWQLLSLVGARKAGIQLKSSTYSNTKKYLMSVRQEGVYEFGYKSPKAKPTTTAIALTLLMYLGQTPGYSPFDDAVDKMARRGPTLTNVYHDYYATLALHHWRHRDWEEWNTKLRDHLVSTQAKSGHEAGSWHFKDEWGDVGGRVYTTAMATLILEVYYRFLPLYEQPPEFPL